MMECKKCRYQWKNRIAPELIRRCPSCMAWINRPPRVDRPLESNPSAVQDISSASGEMKSPFSK